VVALVLVRLVVAAAVAFGPWTNSAADLRGWDVARFHEIATAEGRPWVDHEVEYPPGSVLLAELVGWRGVVTAHRLVVLVALLADLGIAAVARSGWGSGAARRYLLLGTFVLPTMYLRFDLLAALFAVGAWAAYRRQLRAAWVGALVAGFMVKTWPVMLLGLALQGRRWRELAAGAAALGASLGLWVVYAGVAGPRQVASFRGATGWHIESVTGVLVHLIRGGAVALEEGAYRFGAVPEWLRVAGLVVAGLVWVGAWWPGRTSEGAGAVTTVLALLVTSTLLSPQFVVWLLPFATFAPAELGEPLARLARWCVITTGVAALIVAPSAAAELGAQLVLLVRNGLLVVTLVVAIRAVAPPWLARPGWPGRQRRPPQCPA
jgi:hypothetical protein